MLPPYSRADADNPPNATRVLTTFSTLSNNWKFVETGSGGSRGATGGRRGTPLFWSRGTMGPRNILRIRTSLCWRAQVTDKSRDICTDTWICVIDFNCQHKHRSHSSCGIPLPLSELLGWAKVGMCTYLRATGLSPSASARLGFLPPGAGFLFPIPEAALR